MINRFAPTIMLRKPGLVLVILALSLSGCASLFKKHEATTEESGKSAESKQHAPLQPVEYPLYRVKAGDTLYGISLRFDKDYRDLARINKLDEKSRIYVDQVLHLESTDASEKPAIPTAVKPLEKGAAEVVVKNTDTKSSQKNPLKTKDKIKTQTGVVVADGKSAATVAKNPPSVSSPVQASGKSGSLKWSWPVSGQVLKRFSNEGVGSKGIDIAGTRGDAVKASADGVVVYAGEGLVGYGKLIILRHNDEYITAYAHNDKLIAAEGQKVKQGQTIAELGSTGADRDKLHFEIRFQGKPVDPMTLLPGS